MEDKLLENLDRVIAECRRAALDAGRDPDDVRIIPATKTVPAEKVNLLLDRGITAIGENRVQELLDKYEKLDRRFEIHFIGKLQTNKVKYIVDKVSMIQSVDSKRLCDEISKRCAAIGKTMDILIEINIGREESKSGIFPEDAAELAEYAASLPNIRVRGLMTIPPNPSMQSVPENDGLDTISDDNFGRSQKIYTTEAYFKKVKELALDILQKKSDNDTMQELSMGMSADYETAIKCGATIVRPGRAIFGERIYK